MKAMKPATSIRGHLKAPNVLNALEEKVLNVNNKSCVQILRAVVSQIPFVGGIDILYSNFVKEIEEKNFIIYIQNLIDQRILDKIEILKENQDPHKYLLQFLHL